MATNNAINNSFYTLQALTNGSTIIDNLGFTLLNLNTSGTTPVNSIQLVNANTGFAPYFKSVGSDTNVSLQLDAQGTGGVNIKGTGTNNSAAAGYVGELISSIVSSASPVSLSTGTSKTVTSISLTAGDWDVYGMIGTTSGAGTLTTVLVGSISSINNTRETDVNETVNYTVSSASSTPGLTTPYVRLSLSTTTTYYLIATAVFSVSTLNAFGKIQARRAR